MKPNNLYKFFVNFFTQLKIYIFPIYYSILNKKKTFYIFRKKNRARCFDIREKILFNNRYFKKKFYSKLHNKVGKIKKKFFMKPNNLFKFFVNFFYSIKNIYFPDILPHFKQKKNFLYISKKKSSLDASIFAKNFCSIIAILKFFYSKLRNMSGKLKKNFFMKPNNLFKFFVKFFYSIKNIYFPDILQHFKQKKTFYIFRKKNPASMLRYSRKIFVQQSLFKIFLF